MQEKPVTIQNFYLFSNISRLKQLKQAGTTAAIASRSVSHSVSTSLFCFKKTFAKFSLLTEKTKVYTKKQQQTFACSVTRCWNKKLPNVFHKLLKGNNTSFCLKSGEFQNNPKSHQIFWLLLCEGLLPSKFIYRPIWSHCLFVTMAVAQLAEWSLQIPEVRGTNPIICKTLNRKYFSLNFWKVENREKEAGNGPLL